MSSFTNSFNSLRDLDDLSRRESYIHNLHPLIKIITTVVYLIVVLSFDRYEIVGLLPLVFFPLIVILLADIPAKIILMRLLFIEPFIIGIGILNPLFDHSIMTIYGFSFSSGWVTFLSIFIKSGLTVTIALLLIATTGMDKLSHGLRLLKTPKLLVLQLMLTYRYISVLMEELGRLITAYSLRAPKQKGINKKAWGSLLGQLIFRTFDRADRVYQAMCLRGFKGEYNCGYSRVKAGDIIYLVVWISFFVLIRIYNVPMLIGLLLTGVIK